MGEGEGWEGGKGGEGRRVGKGGKRKGWETDKGEKEETEMLVYCFLRQKEVGDSRKGHETRLC